MARDRLRVALIGCGAVTELFHLPALGARSDMEITLLVDKRLSAAQRLAARIPGATVAAEPAAAAGRADLAVVAVPHRLHTDITVQLLGAGVHVLVEKPMAMSTAECDAMIAAARASGRVLAVGMQRRFERASQYVKAILDAGLLGRIRSVDLRDGGVYGWPVADAAMLSAREGGGVVTGIGIHALDLLAWWLGDPLSVAYRDDAQGGVEADCEFRLELPGGVRALVEFSRTRALRNTWRIVGERAHLEVGVGPNAEVRLYPAQGGIPLTGRVHSAGELKEGPKDLLARQFDDLAAAVRGEREPLVSGVEGRRAIAIMEAGLRARESLPLPWMAPARTAAEGAPLQAAGGAR